MLRRVIKKKRFDIGKIQRVINGLVTEGPMDFQRIRELVAEQVKLRDSMRASIKDLSHVERMEKLKKKIK